jgi:ribonuclease PH
MALVDAGVGMDGLFAGVTLGWGEDGVMSLDPTQTQEVDSKGVVHLSMHCQSQKIITTYTFGELSLQQLQQSISVAKSVSQTNVEFYRECIERKLSKGCVST